MDIAANGGSVGVADNGMWISQHFDSAMSRGNWDRAISAHTAHEWHVERLPGALATGMSRVRAISDSRVVSFSGDSGVTCIHDRDAVRRTARQDLSIIFPVEGDASLDVAGNSVALRPGMFTLTDSSRPMALEIPSGFRQLYFIFPKRRVLSIFPFAEEFVGVPLMADKGLLSFFIDHLTTIENHLTTFDDRNAHTILDVTLDLLAMTLNSLDPDRIISPRDRQLSRVKSFIESRLCDPDLDLTQIADANGVNVRYLHKMFAGSGTTVSNHVRKRRLAMCKRDMDAPALAHRSITEIAMRWGFNDMSHFSKAFRNEFGQAPSQYRSQSRH